MNYEKKRYKGKFNTKGYLAIALFSEYSWGVGKVSNTHTEQRQGCPEAQDRAQARPKGIGSAPESQPGFQSVSRSHLLWVTVRL